MNIMISYNRQSEAITRTLAGDIEALGHTVWFDQDLSGGQAWWKQILAHVRECDIFVFALSPEALNSTACKREYAYAAELGKPILPVLVSEEVSTNLLPPALSQIQFVDYREQDRGTAFRLARALNDVPQPKPLPDPLPSPPEVPISYLGSLAEQVGTAASLSYEEQSTLVVDLKRELRDLETADDARKLLVKLRKRRDLFVTIADEIDELLARAPKVSLKPDEIQIQAAEEKARLKAKEEARQKDEEEVRRLKAEKEAKRKATEEEARRKAEKTTLTEAKALDEKPKLQKGHITKPSATTRFEKRIQWAMIYAVFGFLYVMVFGIGDGNQVETALFFGSIAGVIAGFVTGRPDRISLISMISTIFITSVVVGMIMEGGRHMWIAIGAIGWALGSILGAIIGIIFRKKMIKSK